MDTETVIWVLSFIVSLILTVMAYGAGPILLLLTYKGYIEPKKLRWIHILYTVAICVIFNVYNYNHGYHSSTAPAFIWGTIFYQFNKAKFEKRKFRFISKVQAEEDGQTKEFIVDQETGEVLKETVIKEPEPEQLSIEDFMEPKPPVPNVEPQQTETVTQPEHPVRPTRWAMLCGILAVICAVSLAGNGLQAYWNVSQQKTHQAGQSTLEKELSEQKKLVSDLQDVRSDLMSENNELKEKNTRLLKSVNDIFPEYSFYVRTIGLIVEGSKYYHSYYCETYKNSDEFWAHNIEYCEYLGYSPCPVCLGEDATSDSNIRFNINKTVDNYTKGFYDALENNPKFDLGNG